MICCTLLAGLFALALAMLAPWRGKTQSPLAWRPGSEPTAARRFSLTARLRSFAYAFSGFGYLIRNEHNARIHLAIAAVVVLAGLWFRISLDDWRWIMAAIALVLAAEAMNTAVEQVCDAISTDYNPRLGRAKDLASCTVLLASLGATAIGAATFLPYLSIGSSWEAYGPGVLCGIAR